MPVYHSMIWSKYFAWQKLNTKIYINIQILPHHAPTKPPNKQSSNRSTPNKAHGNRKHHCRHRHLFKHIKSTTMPHLINGSKAWSYIPINPETIGQLYTDIANKYGPQAILKPAPGKQYQKLKHPISGMDMAAFRELPSQITAISPPRLFQTKAWSYQGRFYMDCEVFWQFHNTTTILPQ